MEKIIIGIHIDVRSKAAENVQKLLTEYGCYIKTRLGMHQHADVSCTEKGLIILEMIDNINESAEELIKKLEVLDGVDVKSMRF
jgi:predicted transcriptional regulator